MTDTANCRRCNLPPPSHPADDRYPRYPQTNRHVYDSFVTLLPFFILHSTRVFSLFVSSLCFFFFFFLNFLFALLSARGLVTLRLIHSVPIVDSMTVCATCATNWFTRPRTAREKGRDPAKLLASPNSITFLRRNLPTELSLDSSYTVGCHVRLLLRSTPHPKILTQGLCVCVCVCEFSTNTKRRNWGIWIEICSVYYKIIVEFARNLFLCVCIRMFKIKI